MGGGPSGRVAKKARISAFEAAGGSGKQRLESLDAVFGLLAGGAANDRSHEPGEKRTGLDLELVLDAGAGPVGLELESHCDVHRAITEAQLERAARVVGADHSVHFSLPTGIAIHVEELRTFLMRAGRDLLHLDAARVPARRGVEVVEDGEHLGRRLGHVEFDGLGDHAIPLWWVSARILPRSDVEAPPWHAGVPPSTARLVRPPGPGSRSPARDRPSRIQGPPPRRSRPGC